MTGMQEGPHQDGRILTSSNVASIVDAMRDSAVRSAEQLRERQPGEGVLPALPPLRELLPAGGLVRGSVVVIDRYGALCLALMAGASAAGAWCAVAGVPEFGVVAAAETGVNPDRLLHVPHPGERWHQVVATLLEGCEVVLVSPPTPPPAQVRQRLEAVLRRGSGVMLVTGEWAAAPLRLKVTQQHWTGLGDGHGRLRACQAEVVAEGRGAAGRPRRRWLWLPAADGTVTAAEPGEPAWPRRIRARRTTAHVPPCHDSGGTGHRGLAT